MDHTQLIDDLESAIKDWRSEQRSNGPSSSAEAVKERSRNNVLAAARSLVTALEGPRNILVQLSKSVWFFLPTMTVAPSAQLIECSAGRPRGFENCAHAEYLRKLGKR